MGCNAADGKLAARTEEIAADFSASKNHGAESREVVAKLYASQHLGVDAVQSEPIKIFDPGALAVQVPVNLGGLEPHLPHGMKPAIQVNIAADLRAVKIKRDTARILKFAVPAVDLAADLSAEEAYISSRSEAIRQVDVP